MDVIPRVIEDASLGAEEHLHHLALLVSQVKEDSLDSIHIFPIGYEVYIREDHT